MPQQIELAQAVFAKGRNKIAGEQFHALQ